MSIVDDTAASLQEDKNADIIEALCLGIRDYLKKCGFNTVHLGLSGGIDSALVAALAARALGPDKVRAFGLPSPYSSQGSVQDAMDLAKNLRIEFSVMTIADLFAQCTKDLNPYFKDMPEDITEENLQARLRGLLLMAYSNKFGSLLLTTGNKSELAVGYATLYGDMCGSLAVIGDLFKTEVYELARYLNKDGEIIPETIISKAPSAELRPGQKDQDSLPPYDLLDQILARYILESKTAREIIKEGFNEGLVREIITKVGYAEYKRRQAPPVLKVSPKAFGTGRRMPIARHIYEA
jgi:NAD+ synthase (glutamine-hydrolysing)